MEDFENWKQQLLNLKVSWTFDNTIIIKGLSYFYFYYPQYRKTFKISFVKCNVFDLKSDLVMKED